MNQPDLFTAVPPVIYGDRDGLTFDHTKDSSRLNNQMQAVYNLMADGRWRTKTEICKALPQFDWASINARLRDLRKSKFGGFSVPRERVSRGLFRYRMADRGQG